MDADIHTLFESDHYRIRDFRCRCQDCATSKPEYNETFCISFVRQGNFLFNVFRQSLDSYTGCVLVTKPGYDRTVAHIHTVPDECTIFEFKETFYTEILEQYAGVKFLFDNDQHATLLKIHPDVELLHYQVRQHIMVQQSAGQVCDKLYIDNLVTEIVETVLGKISDYKPDFDIYDSNKQNHLVTIERAKDYITRHYQENISLKEIAEHSNVSPFHFSRLFKKLTAWSPHQFLLQVRLKHSELLLKNTEIPVVDIAYSSGFNSLEHFSYAFRSRYRFAPLYFRRADAAFSKKS
jgi:AraC family transcriptional regulator